MTNSKNTLKWSFDVNTFRLLGRDLITDRITALFELVKNSYDANAENVLISFENVGSIKDNSRIIIKDDGVGMSLKDIQEKWMVIGAKNKRKTLYSPKPYMRRYIGEKGIGRFAVDKLGQFVRIRTREKNADKELIVTINWQEYEELAAGDQTSLTLFTEIENSYEFVEPTFEHGTILELLIPREIWELSDIQGAHKELSRLVSPFNESKYPFKIRLSATEYAPYASTEPRPLQSTERDFASHEVKLGFNQEEETQEYLFFNKKTEKLEIRKTEKPAFGFIKFYLFYFHEEAKSRFNSFYRKNNIYIDGLKIYRDGILTTPFAEYEAKDEKRRDILGINKRRWRATFNRLASRDIIGYIEITREGNPRIIDATNRQDFLSTPEYSELKDFVYVQLDEFMKSFKIERDEKKKKNIGAFKKSQDAIKEIQKEFNKLQRTEKTEKKAVVIKTLENKISILSEGFQAINTEYKEEKKEGKRKEKMYFSLMSLSLFAANVSHAVRTVIYSIKDDAEYLNDNRNEIKNNDERFSILTERIHREIQRLLKVVDFMLKYARADFPDEDFNLKDTIENAFDAHESIFIQNRIDVNLELDQDLHLMGNKVMFQDIITNLISNSIKALESDFNRQIMCKMIANKDELLITFSDNGIGIPHQKRDKIFDMYETSTANKGGAGIGLYVVQTSVQALGGTIELLDKSILNKGASFSLRIPFKK